MFIDIIWALIISGLFFLIGLVVQIIATAIADNKNHNRNMERIKEEHNHKVDYMKKEIFFKRKLRYFEKVSKIIEKTIEDFSWTIIELRKDKPDLKKLLELSKNNETIKSESSTLYSDSYSLKNFLPYIMKFEESIISFCGKMLEYKINKKNKETLKELEEILNKVRGSGIELKMEMREELVPSSKKRRYP